MKDKHFIGIDLGASKLRVGLVEGGKLLNVKVASINSLSDSEYILEQIVEGIASIITSSTEGIGIGVPSVVDTDNGIVYDVVNIPSWNEIHLKEIMESQFNVPVCVDNDVNCFVIGERYYGEGIGFKDVIGITIGSGIGSGIITDDKLYHGHNCGAGEIGMLPYKGSILEHYASSQFFERQYNIKGSEVYKHAQKGDKQALKAYERFGRHVGSAIKIIMYTYDPEIIIIGGGVSRSFQYFEKSMHQELSEFDYSQSVENIKIRVSSTEHTAIMGAAQLAMQAVGIKNVN